MSEKVFIKNIPGSLCGILRAGTENMVGGATEHAATEPHRVGASEVSCGVNRIICWSSDRGWLVSLHCLFGRGEEDFCDSGDVV